MRTYPENRDKSRHLHKQIKIIHKENKGYKILVIKLNPMRLFVDKFDLSSLWKLRVISRIETGSLFQRAGAALAKARSPYRIVLDLGFINK